MTITQLLTAADSAYYEGRPALMTDSAYDALARMVGHQSFVTAELPSLDNAICESEFYEWLDRIPAADRNFYVEPKIDGVSVLVQYQDGQPVAARTRKLDVPVQTLALPCRPGFTGAARGEAWHPDGRPYASGRIRARDAAASIRWTPFCSSAAERQDWPAEALAPWHLSTGDPEQLLAVWASWRAGHICPGLPTDGLVVKLASPDARARLGSTKRAPLWALALK